MLTNRILFILKYVFRKSIVKLGFYSKPSFLIIGAQKSGTPLGTWPTNPTMMISAPYVISSTTAKRAIAE